MNILSFFMHPAPSPQTIREAILLGDIAELDAVLDGMEDEEDYSPDLRHGIEALRHFRFWYGNEGELKPATDLERRKVSLLETAWGAELLALLDPAKPAAAKLA